MNELVTLENKEIKDLISYLPEYKPMLESIKAGHAERIRAKSLFGKQQSQFMDNMLTASKLTPIRNARQILAEMNKTEQALSEAFHNCRRKDVERKIHLRDAENETDELKRELCFIDAEQKLSELESTKNYICGAIRKLANYQAQYNSICEHHGVKNFNELDLEVEEERYHIMTAFEQGLNAARSRQGVIDEGNLIYFTQIGVNGSHAQRLMIQYLNAENDSLNKGQEPSYDMQLKFLNDVAEKFKGCSMRLAAHKGMSVTTEQALLKRGDTRLLGGEKE